MGLFPIRHSWAAFNLSLGCDIDQLQNTAIFSKKYNIHPICLCSLQALNNFLAFKCKLAYNKNQRTSCTEPFRLIAHARKNSKRLLRGLFYVGIKADLEVKMMITLKKGMPNGDVKKIKIEGKGDKEKEVNVRHETVPSKWKTWNHEDFSRERN
jgi:hypothetical protein